MKKLSYFLAAFFAALLLAGLLLGDAREVWAKAARICLACIGLG